MATLHSSVPVHCNNAPTLSTYLNADWQDSKVLQGTQNQQVHFTAEEKKQPEQLTS